jgi:hypothetical protein
VPVAEVARLTSPAVRESLAARLRAVGFRYVTLDLEGFRSGSLNELVNLETKRLYASAGEPDAPARVLAGASGSPAPRRAAGDAP